MAFTIPNNNAAGITANPQSLIFQTDVDILTNALQGIGVKSGCAVTAQGSPDMTVAVASGVVTVNATANVSVTSGNVTVTTADATYPRIDLIVVNGSGTKSCTAGTPSASPTMPAHPATSVVLAAIYVPAAATTITTSRIVDKRAFVPDIVPAGGTTNQILVPTTGAPPAWSNNLTVPGNLSVTGTIGVTGTGTYTGGQRASIYALSDGASITPDFATGNNFSVTLAGNRTLENPTNLVAGQSGSIFITQDGTGSRTLAYGTYWDFPAGTAPTLSTGAAAVDRLDYIVRTTTSIHAALSKNFS